MKKDPLATANAAAITTAVVYLVCAAFFLFAPDFAMDVARSWFHGIDIAQLGGPQFTAGRSLWGLITASVFAWGVGYVFALSYNYFVKK
ncbi:MAG: DUF5676 family membrane protein [Patescibacteria group bacterium]